MAGVEDRVGFHRYGGGFVFTKVNPTGYKGRVMAVQHTDTLSLSSTYVYESPKATPFIYLVFYIILI